MNVEFTDRYGGRPPSWLRGCFDQCEAMGWYPTKERPIGRAVEPDGWYFVKCEACKGTGRVSWLVTIGRIPRWLVRGVRTCWQFRPSAPMHVPEWSWSKRLWVAFKVAFLADLGVRM